MKKYREPGAGAVDFARQYVKDLTREQALQVIRKLVNGELSNSNDKRIKCCSYCGYFYRDYTRPNNSKTCSKKCKIDRDTLKRAKKRADESLLKPKKKSKREVNYAYWLEYPFWSPAKEMLKYSRRVEVPKSPTQLARIDGAKQRSERLGGKRKPVCVVPYHGDEKETGEVYVKFPGNNRKPGGTQTTIMDTKEIEEYLLSRYSERHLRLERQRARDKKRW